MYIKLYIISIYSCTLDYVNGMNCQLTGRIKNKCLFKNVKFLSEYVFL